MIDTTYIEQVEGAYRVRGSRVSLDSVVYAFLDGEPAESIARAFPTLTLEQVYGAVTYYLAHQAEIDVYLEKERAHFEEQRRRAREKDPVFYQKLAAAKARRLQSA
jgi:uncharacterized protein (DUF433 family)